MEDGNIYFPADGAQPTTEEAVKYLCANIDNREDSPITEWYMKMFGAIPFQNTGNSANDYVKAGWNKDSHQARLISFLDESVSQKSGFINAIKKLASTSVGRVLLYRILIEARRKQLVNNEGCFEQCIESANNVQVRNASRSVIILFPGCNSFKETTIKKLQVISALKLNHEFDEQAKIDFNDSKKSTIVVENKNENSYFLSPEERSVDIALFHEMCHWYHFLRDSDRLTLENASGNLLGKLLENRIGSYFYDKLEGTDSEERIVVSANSWRRILKDLTRTISYEEMRNILGAPKDHNYINGDDLSENLYRACVQTYMRFSHSDDKYFEDARVIEKAKELANGTPYIGLKYSEGTVDDSIGFYQEQGLGNCLRRPEPAQESRTKKRRSLGEEQE